MQTSYPKNHPFFFRLGVLILLSLVPAMAVPSITAHDHSTVIWGNGNTVNNNYSPQLLREISTKLDRLTQNQNKENRLAQENQQLKAQMRQLSQQLARATANHDTAAIQAVRGLNQGNLSPTADYLRAIAQKARSEGIHKNAQAAEAMRQLASISTTAEALKALQSACDYEPDNALNWNLLGDMHLQAGDVARAEGAYTQLLQLAQTATRSHPNDLNAQRDLSVSYNKIGNIQQTQGDLKGALASYQATHAILKTLAQKDTGNNEAQRDLSVSYNNIGTIQQAQGDLKGALASYRASLAIRQSLAQKDTGNVQGQTDLVISYWKLAHVSQGNESKGFLRQGLAILEQLARENRLDADQKSRWLPLFRNALAH